MGNKETVTIYGQEYTIAGSSSGEQIIEVARYVDDMMNQISTSDPHMSASSLAILTAVNITNEYFDIRDKNADQENEIADLQKDVSHFEMMWEEAKAGLKKYREDSESSAGQLQEMQRIFNAKNIELNRVNEELELAKNHIEELTKNLKDINEKMEAEHVQKEESARKDSEDATEAKRKYKELESSFFDIQMENIQLKNKLDSMKKRQK